MAYLDAILNSELLSYITATILITIAVWLFSGAYSCVSCASDDRKDVDDGRTMTAKSGFKLLLAATCAVCSALLIYRTITSPPEPSALPSFSTARTPGFRTGGGNDGSAFDSDFEECDSFN